MSSSSMERVCSFFRQREVLSGSPSTGSCSLKQNRTAQFPEQPLFKGKRTSQRSHSLALSVRCCRHSLTLICVTLNQLIVNNTYPAEAAAKRQKRQGQDAKSNVHRSRPMKYVTPDFIGCPAIAIPQRVAVRSSVAIKLIARARQGGHYK